MQNLDYKHKKYLSLMLISVAFCEIMLKIENNIIQFMGIMLLPVIVTFTVLLLKQDRKKQL